MRRIATVTLALVALTTFAAAQQPLDYRVTVKGEAAKGSPNDHFLTFSAPFQIPKVSLPAGSYVFTFMAPSVVRVSSADRSQSYATFYTTPIQQVEISDKYEMVFTPSGEGSPQRIAKWFLPNQSAGYEFLYPSVNIAVER